MTTALARTTNPKPPVKTGIAQRRKVLADQAALVARAREQMNPALSKAADKVNNHLRRMKKVVVLKLWQLGVFLKKVQSSETKFGTNPVQLIEKVVDDDYRGYVGKSVYLTNVLTEKELHWMLSLKMKSSGKTLSWLHIEKLLSVKTEPERKKLATRIVEEDMTADELQLICLKVRGPGTVKNTGGRPVKMIVSPIGRLMNAEKIFGIVKRNTAVMWLNEQYGFETLARDIPADRITPDLINHYAQAIVDAEEAEDKINQTRKALEAGKALLTERMEAQAQQQGTDDADAIANNKTKQITYRKPKAAVAAS